VECGPAVTVTASADSWIVQDDQSKNQGSDSNLKVQSKSGANYRVVVHFNQPDLPQGCVVDTATLRLYSGSSNPDRTLEAWQLAGQWSENSVTWGNQPGTTGVAATTISGDGWRDWSVAALVQAMYDAGANYGFLIRDASEDDAGGLEQQFFSREAGSNAPEIILTFKPAGE